MAIIKRSGSYQARLESPDGSILSKTFPTKREAEMQLALWKQQKRDGSLVTNASRQMTLDEYYEVWMKDLIAETPQDKRSGWRTIQQQYFRHYISPFIGEVRVTEVRPQHVRLVLNEMIQLGRSEQTRLHVYGILRKMFADAIENYQVVSVNPALRKFRPTIPQREARHLNIEQTKRLLTHVDGKKYGLAVWVQLYMGLRVGELQALHWEDIDLDTGRITIRRNFLRKTWRFKDYPKGKKQHSHTVPMELLEKLRAARHEAKSDLVVSTSRGGVISYVRYLKALRAYLKELKLPSVGTHGLRHSTSELYMSHGASRDDIRNLFAHSSLSVTERYLHGRESGLEKVANVIRLFPNRIDPKSTQIGSEQKAVRKEVS